MFTTWSIDDANLEIFHTEMSCDVNSLPEARSVLLFVYFSEGRGFEDIFGSHACCQFVVIVIISAPFLQILNSSAFSIFGLELYHATRPEAISKQESFQGPRSHKAEALQAQRPGSLQLTSKLDRAGDSFLSVRSFFSLLRGDCGGQYPWRSAQWLTNEVSEKRGHSLVPIQLINTGIYYMSWLGGGVLRVYRAASVNPNHWCFCTVDIWWIVFPYVTRSFPVWASR